MIKTAELKKAVVGKLKEAYPPPEYTHYGIGVKEDFNKPCFFTQVMETQHE